MTRKEEQKIVYLAVQLYHADEAMWQLRAEKSESLRLNPREVSKDDLPLFSQIQSQLSTAMERRIAVRSQLHNAIGKALK